MHIVSIHVLQCIIIFSFILFYIRIYTQSIVYMYSTVFYMYARLERIRTKNDFSSMCKLLYNLYIW